MSAAIIEKASETSHAATSKAAPLSALDETAGLARDILDSARSSLMLSLRFMDVALWHMPFEAANLNRPLATDGYVVFFDPVRVVRSYLQAPNEVIRDYLHTILHCVFRHTFDDRHPSRRAWDIACDVAIEACALELCALRYPCMKDDERMRALERLREECAQITAQHVYRLIVADRDEQAGASKTIMTSNFVALLQSLFARDDHGVWTRMPERPAAHRAVDARTTLREGHEGDAIAGDEGPEEEPEDDAPGSPSVDLPGSPAPSAGGTAVEIDVEGGDRFVLDSSEAEAEAQFLSMAGVKAGDFEGLTWKDISQRIEMDMEAFTGKIGATAGTFEINLTVANRKQYDFRQFLKRFSSMSEELKVSTEEFDYIFYTYGLRRYGNMPLIEPLEYQESNRIRDFVIAIDTSASCAGDLVKRFAERTYDVLKSTEGFGRKVNVHVIQCDCEMRKDTKITSIRDLDQGFQEFKLRGYGGTDFRPVFKYVDELIEQKELTNLKGMIYFTDGLGKFPIEPPDYETVFVFFNDLPKNRSVPPWAMKVIMDEDDIVEL